MRRVWNLVLANPAAAMKSPESLSPRFDSLPKPLPEGSAWSREFTSLLIHCVECSTREELEQAVDLITIRHVWPTFAARTMLQAVRAELLAKR